MTESEKRIMRALRSLPVRHAGVVFGEVVTRWAEDAFEVGSVGRYSETAENASRRMSAGLGENT